MYRITNKYILLIGLWLSAICIVYADKGIVKTTHGSVSGKILKTLIKEVPYHGFMGIPYAASPTNNLRFLPTQELKPWEGVLSAKKERPPCIQFNTNVKKRQPFGIYGKEDCLYLDIYTPAPDDEKRASIVFVYNEHFKNSYNKTRDYAPDFFIEEDVIVVTISHRLSVFGFLSVEEDRLPGNAGLRDIVAGLEWVKNNIQNFGGDPKRITLLGSQGGAAAVDLLIHSKAKELFNSAILQSGTSLIPTYLQENVRERAFKLAELLDRASSSSNRLLQDLNEISAEDLLTKEISAAPQDYNKENQKPVLTFGPIVEKNPDGLVTEYPENSSGKVNMPIMIGFNSREGLEASMQYLLQPMFLGAAEKDFPFVMPLRLKFKFDPVDDSFDDAENEIKKFYFTNSKVTIHSVSDYITFIGDVLAAYPVDKTAKLYANISDSPVYYYYFDYYSDLNENKNNIMKLATVEDGTWGAATGDELCYLFKCPDLKDKYKKHSQTQSEEIKIQNKLIKMWANFAKYGNPTPSGENQLKDVQWPPHNVNTKEYLHIGRQIKIKRDLYSERFKFWDLFIRKWEKQARNGIVYTNKRDEF